MTLLHFSTVPPNQASWFNLVESALVKYELLSIAELLIDPPTRGEWKRLSRTKVTEWWIDSLKEEATTTFVSYEADFLFHERFV